MQILDEVKPLKNVKKQAKRSSGKTPEGKVKARVKAILDELGCYWFMPVAGGFGSSGVPDIITCVKGRFVAIETKSVHSSHGVTRLQALNLNKIEKNGGITFVINETNIDELYKLKHI